MKDQDTVIDEFNDIVNMTASELESWLKSGDSQSAGWPKEDDDGESVGHDSGRKIVEILESNPDKDTQKYTDDQIQHMRKVVSYCKRHLAQEESANSEKSAEEVKKTKSYASLKNWGHDVLKRRKKANGSDNKAEHHEGEEQTGDKRKAADDDSGANKKREAEKGKSDDGKARNKTNGTNGAHKSNGAEKKTAEDKSDKTAKEDEKENGDEPAKGPEVGETVSWNWGNGQPKGKVLDVKEEKTSIETKRGNTASRKGNAEDPAVVIDTGKSKAVKLAHELN